MFLRLHGTRRSLSRRTPLPFLATTHKGGCKEGPIVSSFWEAHATNPGRTLQRGVQTSPSRLIPLRKRHPPSHLHRSCNIRHMLRSLTRRILHEPAYKATYLFQHRSFWHIMDGLPYLPASLPTHQSHRFLPTRDPPGDTRVPPEQSQGPYSFLRRGRERRKET